MLFLILCLHITGTDIFKLFILKLVYSIHISLLNVVHTIAVCNKLQLWLSECCLCMCMHVCTCTSNVYCVCYSIVIQISLQHRKSLRGTVLYLDMVGRLFAGFGVFVYANLPTPFGLGGHPRIRLWHLHKSAKLIWAPSLFRYIITCRHIYLTSKMHLQVISWKYT